MHSFFILLPSIFTPSKAIITRLKHPSIWTLDGSANSLCFCLFSLHLSLLAFSSCSWLPNAHDCFLVTLQHEFNQSSLFAPAPLATGEDLSPLGEGVQLAETRLVNLPHLNTPNRSTSPFISNHTCCCKTVGPVHTWCNPAREAIKNVMW